jgi:hypothetical protein
MATFISKFLTYGISLPSKKKARFRNNVFSTQDPELVEELRSSKAFGKDFEEVTYPADESQAKGKKK